MDVLEALQKAVFETLDGAMSCPVFDRVPQDQPFPFLVIDQLITDADDAFGGERAFKVTGYLTIFSAYRGKREVIRLLAEAYGALHDADLTLDTGRCVSCRVDRQRTPLDADGVTYNGSIELNIMVQHEET